MYSEADTCRKFVVPALQTAWRAIVRRRRPGWDNEANSIAEQFTLPDVLRIPPILDQGNVMEIITKFGGADELRNVVNELQSMLHAT